MPQTKQSLGTVVRPIGHAKAATAPNQTDARKTDREFIMFRLNETEQAKTTAQGVRFDGGLDSGMVDGTKVAGAMGWRPIETISAGDRVSTFDGGMQEVRQVTRSNLWNGKGPCPRILWPLEVPVGALGNSDVMLLLPEQIVMIESDVAEEISGDAFVLVPATALDGYRGIHRIQPHAPISVTTLHFATDQVVFSNFGAMFFTPSAGAVDVSLLDEQPVSAYRPMSKKLAAQFVGCLAEIEASVVGKTTTPGHNLYAAAV
jgi:hypothetical protein